jgi:hypothetical protein
VSIDGVEQHGGEWDIIFGYQKRKEGNRICIQIFQNKNIAKYLKKASI